jgi:AhpD family alkylhydroperoxidase
MSTARTRHDDEAAHVDLGCRVPLLDREAAFPEVRRAFDRELEQLGRVRNRTRAVACSPAAWQASTRALHVYLTLRRVEPRLVHVLCLYTSMLNRCEYCVDDAAGEALDSGWTADELRGLLGPLEDAFTAREAAALRFAGALTTAAADIAGEDFEAVAAHFDAEGLMELSVTVAMKNFWNRFASGLAIPPEGRCEDRALVADLLRNRTPALGAGPNERRR